MASLGPGFILWYDLSNKKGACMGQVHLQHQPGN